MKTETSTAFKTELRSFPRPVRVVESVREWLRELENFEGEFTSVMKLRGSERVRGRMEERHRERTEAKGEMETPKPEATLPRIILGPKARFSSFEEAHEHVRKSALQGRHVAPMVRHQRRLTGSFFKGTAEGQITSIFQNMKVYGAKNVKARILGFVDFAEKSMDPLFMKFREWEGKGLSPTDPETFSGGHINKFFVKYLLLKRIGGELTK